MSVFSHELIKPTLLNGVFSLITDVFENAQNVLICLLLVKTPDYYIQATFRNILLCK